MFGQNPATVLHCYIQSPPVQLHHGDAELKPANTHAFQWGHWKITVELMKSRLIKPRREPTSDHKSGSGFSSRFPSSSGQFGSCQAAGRGVWRGRSHLWWRLSSGWRHTTKKSFQSHTSCSLSSKSLKPWNIHFCKPALCDVNKDTSSTLTPLTVLVRVVFVARKWNINVKMCGTSQCDSDLLNKDSKGPRGAALNNHWIWISIQCQGKGNEE